MSLYSPEVCVRILTPSRSSASATIGRTMITPIEPTIEVGRAKIGLAAQATM